MCLATVSPTSGRNDSVANDGMPPVRSGHMVASSARHRHKKQPAIVITPMRRMPRAPVPSATAGAIPVTRIVPARPITKAPHQLVPFTRPFSGWVTSMLAMLSPFQQSPLEERQVALYLPVAHDRVPGVEFLALHLGEVIDVVPIRSLAQGIAQHVVADKLVRRVQQGRRQRPDASRGDILSGHGMQVVAVRLAWVKATVDAVQACSELSRQREIRIC